VICVLLTNVIDGILITLLSLSTKVTIAVAANRLPLMVMVAPAALKLVGLIFEIVGGALMLFQLVPS
jgi:hypothetical protein